jgi:hypothetical protein
MMAAELPNTCYSEVKLRKNLYRYDGMKILLIEYYICYYLKVINT